MADRKDVEHIESVKFTDIEAVLGEEFGEAFAAYRQKFRKSINYDKNGFIPDFPLTVSMELVNRCNLACKMCFTVNHQDPMAWLHVEDIQRIMAECKVHDLPAAVIGMGAEALVYKDVRRALETVREAGVMDVFLGTNGYLLNESLSEFLIDQRIARIEVSLDAATPETYEKIRGKPLLPQVEENLRTLIRLRRERGSKLPVIRLCFCVQKENVHEQKAFLEKWQGLVDYIDFQEMVDFDSVDALRQDTDHVRAEGEKLTPLANTYCAYPFNSLHVWSNGDVTPCCTFFGKALVIGNVREASLAEIWNGEDIDGIRKQLLSGKVNPVCKACLTQREAEAFALAKQNVGKVAAVEG